MRWIPSSKVHVKPLLIYQSRHLGNELGQVTDTELQMHSVESVVNIGQKAPVDAKLSTARHIRFDPFLGTTELA